MKQEKSDNKRATIKERIKTSNIYNSVKANKIKSLTLGMLAIYISGIISQGIKAISLLPEILAKKIEGAEVFNIGLITCMKEFCTSLRGFLSLLITIGVGYLIWRFVIYPRIKEETGTTDERGVVYADEGTYGTSRLMENTKLEEILDWKPIGEQEGNILGEIENKVISLPSEKEFEKKVKKYNWKIEDIINKKLNNHTAVVGASGTMKSRAVARISVLQAAARGESMIITDPKGELYEDCAQYLENNGYKVKMFNLIQQEVSDSWSCLSTIGHSSTYAKIFADTIITNANERGDQYWNDNAANLVKAISMYVIESPYEVDKTMGRVYDIIAQKSTAELDGIFASLRENCVARRSYDLFAQCTEQVKGQIKNGLGIMLSVFQDDIIRNITSTNEIDLEEPAYKKCAYFVITSDQHKTFDFLAVLFYAMSFIKLVEVIDRERGKKKAGEEYQETIPINLIMDEMPNIGQIPDFVRKISTVRSRKINITVIFQSLSQLKNRYPNDQWQEILGNCDTTIFLGCTDEATAKYISNKTGIATIEVETVNTRYDRKLAIFNQDTDYREVKSRGQRKVMTDDEILRLKNTDCLVFLRCQKPIICKKFDYTRHPEAKKLEARSIADYKPEWRKKQEEERAKLEKEREKTVSESKRREEEKRKARAKEEEKSISVSGLFERENKKKENKTQKEIKEGIQPQVRNEEKRALDSEAEKMLGNILTGEKTSKNKTKENHAREIAETKANTIEETMEFIELEEE